MIDINELRRLTVDCYWPTSPVSINEILDRLEATEEDRSNFLVEMGKLCAQCDALRAKIEAMEKQKPVATVRINVINGNPSVDFVPGLHYLYHNDKLYLAPGAQPAQKAVAYLDLGVGGYMDIGTDLTDEQLASLPKGRHMLGIVGTYGVDGYVPAQPAPSVPENWLRAIDDALVSTHVGVASLEDTYEQAKAKLDSLIGFHVDAATDPAVNGGRRLVPIEPTEKMVNEGTCASTLPGPRYIDEECVKQCWEYMLAAAQEAKP